MKNKGNEGERIKHEENAGTEKKWVIYMSKGTQQ